MTRLTQIEYVLAHAQPGLEMFSAATGRSFEKMETGEWQCKQDGQVFTDHELAEEEGEDLE